MDMDPVPLRDKPLTDRLGPLDLATRCEIYETFAWRLCVVGGYPLADGLDVMRGCCWRMHDYSPDAEFGVITDTLVRRQLSPAMRQELLCEVEDSHAAAWDGLFGRIALADEFGTIHGLPLAADLMLGSRITLVLNLLDKRHL